MDYYLVTASGQQAGPYGIDQLRAFWKQGAITRTTPYWTAGMTIWRPISDLERRLKEAQTPSPPVVLQPLATISLKPRVSGLKKAFNGCLLGTVLCGVVLAVLSFISVGIIAASGPIHHTAKNGYQGTYAGNDSNALAIRGQWVELTTGSVVLPLSDEKGIETYTKVYGGAISSQTRSSTGKYTLQVSPLYESTQCRSGGLFDGADRITEHHEANAGVLDIEADGSATYTLTDQGDTKVYHFKME
jgi:hypothetical protein